MSDQQFKKFNQNLRTTSTGVKFAKDLYTNPDSLDPKKITNALRALGLNVPKEVQISAELAQMYTSGSAIYEGYETLETADQIKRAEQLQNLNNLSVDQARFATSFAADQGWVKDDQAQLISIGISVCMLIASCGTDIRSWIALAMEINSIETGAKAQAMMDASKNNIQIFQEMVSTQARDLQAAAEELVTGKIGIFGFLSKTAYKSSFLFDQCVAKNPELSFLREMLPGLEFVPKFDMVITTDAEAHTFYGSKQSATASFNYQTSFIFENQFAAMNGIFTRFFLPLMQPYFDFNADAAKYKKVRIQDFAKLVAIDSKQFRFDSFADIQQKFKRTLLTPWDLGLDLFSDLVDSKDEETGVSGFLKSTSKEPSIELVKLADQNGYINTVLANTKARTRVEEVFNYTGFRIAESVKNLANYISMLNMIDLIENDPFYRDNIEFDKTYIRSFFVFEQCAKFQADLDELLKISMIRKTNYLARQNIATLLHTSPNKLIRVNGKQTNQAGIFKIK